jgi:hypothetical protein
MKKNNQKNLIIITCFIVIFTLNIFKDIKEFFIKNTFISRIDTITISSIVVVWLWLYNKYLWKFPLMKKFFGKVNLSGTYFGVYSSCDSIKGKNYKGEIYFKICQDNLGISINTSTKKFQNYSNSEVLSYDEKSNSYKLTYMYSQSEFDKFDYNERKGATVLAVKNTKVGILLEGYFWTTCGTKGSLKVYKLSNRIVDTFSEAKALKNE